MAEHGVEILLVEDNESDAELTIRALKTQNLASNLVHVKNGEEALDFIFAKGAFAGRDLNTVPRVILLDLKMPKVGGIEVLEKLKGDEKTKKIPVVVLTSSNEESDIEACYARGVNSYVVKPVEFETFSKAVSQLGVYWMLLNQLPRRLRSDS